MKMLRVKVITLLDLQSKFSHWASEIQFKTVTPIHQNALKCNPSSLSALREGRGGAGLRIEVSLRDGGGGGSLSLDRHANSMS